MPCQRCQRVRAMMKAIREQETILSVITDDGRRVVVIQSPGKPDKIYDPQPPYCARHEKHN